MVGFSSCVVSPLRSAGSNCASSPFSSAGCQSGNAARQPSSMGATRSAESEAADVKRCGCLPVAEVGHDCGQIGPRDDIEQLLLVDRKAGPDLSQFIDRVDVGNDGVMARSFQPLVVETAPCTLADDQRLGHRDCAE